MKNKALIIGIALLFVGASVVSGVQINSSPQPLSRGWLYVGGSGPGNYTRIQDAIDNASDGDTVFVYDDSSPYFENILVDKSINVIGEDRNTTIIDGGKIDNVVQLISNHITITNFTIQNSINNTYYAGAIEIATNFNLISNNIIKNNFFGIIVKGGNNTIKNNYFFNIEETGILLLDSSDDQILNNQFELSGISISGGSVIDYSSHEIENNTIRNNPIVYFVDKINANIPSNVAQLILVLCRNCVIQNLTIGNVDECIQIYFSDNIKIINNNLSYCNVGIKLYKSNENNISFNTITKTGYGISVSASSNDIISNNSIHECNCGLYISSCERLSIFQNIITGSTPGYHTDFGSGIMVVQSDAIISSNFINNNEYGIMCVLKTAMQSGFIYWNNISHNKYGISVLDCWDIKVQYNDIWYNDHSISILSSIIIFIQNNNIVSNSTILFESILSFGVANKNYWGTDAIIHPRRFARPPSVLFLFFPWKSSPVDTSPP